MATVTERYDSREYTEGDSADLIFTILDAVDESVAMMVLKASSSSVFHGLKRLRCRVEPMEGDGTDWTGHVQYGKIETAGSPPVAEGESSFSFDTTGGTQHVTQSKQTISKTAPVGQTAPDFKGAIGVTKDSVQGVDVTVPTYRFSKTLGISNSLVTDTYKQALCDLTGKVNDDTFEGFDAGEVLFLGASGSRRGDDDWVITFNFAAQKNATNITIGDITVPAKKGLEYLWVRYEDAEDAAAKKLVKRPTAAYVEKVYDLGDFDDLTPS